MNARNGPRLKKEFLKRRPPNRLFSAPGPLDPKPPVKNPGRGKPGLPGPLGSHWVPGPAPTPRFFRKVKKGFFFRNPFGSHRRSHQIRGRGRKGNRRGPSGFQPGQTGEPREAAGNPAGPPVPGVCQKFLSKLISANPTSKALKFAHFWPNARAMGGSIIPRRFSRYNQPRPGIMHDLADFFDMFIEETKGIRVGEHHPD